MRVLVKRCALMCCPVLQIEASANMRALHGSSFATVGSIRAANSAHYCAAPHPAQRAHRAMCIVRAASIHVHSLGAVSLYCSVQTSLQLQLRCIPRRSEVQLSYCSARAHSKVGILQGGPVRQGEAGSLTMHCITRETQDEGFQCEELLQSPLESVVVPLAALIPETCRCPNVACARTG